MAVIERRKASDGVVHYRVRIRLKGQPPQSATFERITDARRWAQGIEAAIREGRHFKSMEAKKHSLAELIDRYILEVLPSKPKSKQTSQLIWWKSRIGAQLLANVSQPMLVEQRDYLLRTPLISGKLRSPSTVVRYIAALSHVFSVGVKEWGWVEENPFRKISKPKEPKGRTRFLSDQERIDLLAACRASDCPYLYTIVVLALSTGMRYSEILWLTWDDVNLPKGQITLRETKNGETRVVPLVSHAHDEIAALAKNRRRLDTRLLFPNSNVGEHARPYTIRKLWLRALQQANVTNFRFHDLRHSAASYLAMQRGSPSEIAAVLGHKTLQMVKRYAHLSEAHTTNLVRTMNDKMFASPNA